MKSYLSQELRQTIEATSKEIETGLHTIANGFSPEKALAIVQAALAKQQALYDENISNLSEEIMESLADIQVNDFTDSTSYITGTDFLLDMIVAKKLQITQLLDIELHLNAIINSFDTAQKSLLEISVKFNKMLV